MKFSKITTEQWYKVVKAALYLGASATVSYVVSAIADNPYLFGTLTPIINIVLVTLKQSLTDTK